MHSTNARLRLISRLQRQHGSILITSLILLFAFTLIVLGTSQHLLVEQRISANQNDRQQAFQLAQLTLQVGESKAIALTPRLAGLSPQELFGNAHSLGIFTSDCSNGSNPTGITQGLCLSARQAQVEQPAWERTVARGNQPTEILSPCGYAIEYQADSSASQRCLNGNPSGGRQLWANPRYIIELLDPHYSDGNHPNGSLYRITVRAWGRNRHTQVTLQSHYLVSNNENVTTLTLIPLLENVTP